jgi:hypothetical protein
MLKYFIPLLIIYFIYIYNNLFINSLFRETLKGYNRYLSLLIEKNILILIVSIISILIIWKKDSTNEDMAFIILLILINLVLWIKFLKIKNYSLEADELFKKELFISSVAKPIHNSYISEEARRQFEDNFLNECYNNKLIITDFKPITSPEEVEADDSLIRSTTIDLALNSDNMFSVQQEENKCIIANYIPNNLELINTNTTNFE